MIYVTSDLHGYPLKKFKELLNKANFGENDFLFILGDVVDRGEDSIKILEWTSVQANVQLILGNHEAMMLSCDFICDEITDKSISELNEDKISLLSNWMINGGEQTIKGLRDLKAVSSDAIMNIFDYLRDAPLYETISLGDRDFLLVHSGLDNFRKNKKISDYTSDELLWCNPELEDRYYSDIMTVMGHTPTQWFGKEYKGKIVKTDTWICVDTGAGHGGAPSLLRLDDLKEFYV